MCAGNGMPAVAVTDTNNLFGALEFSETASKAGIQPIIGCQLDLAYATAARPGDRMPKPLPVVLLAQSEAGYGNLMKLSSHAYLEAGAELPHVTLPDLAAHSDGLICLTGGALGPVGQLIRDGQMDQARALAGQLATMYPQRLYMELHRHGSEGAKPRRAAPAANTSDARRASASLGTRSETRPPAEAESMYAPA